MKNTSIIELILPLLFIAVFTGNILAQDSLISFLESIPGAVVTEFKTDDHFNKKYEVFIDQYIDHENPEAGTFRQRFFVCHKSQDKPLVFVTEGYTASYVEYEGYRTELSNYLDANEIVVEHRYFTKSVPDPLDWTYLTVANAAADHHHIVELMKPFYQGKWVSTGISKGGQTAMYHRTFYPDDVDATVGYVCPLNFSAEDLRAYAFLDQVGDSACRQKIHDFQKSLLENKDSYLPVFGKLAKKRDATFSRGIEAGFEFLVLEYSFAFWQWGIECDQIPPPGTTPEKMVSHMVEVTGVDWGSDEGIQDLMPFFYAAITEIGMYGYDFSEFDGLITALNDNTFSFTCPDGYDCTYKPEAMQKVDYFVRHEADQMMFIYGEYDAWSSTAVQWSGNPGVVKIVKPEGSHGTRIRNLPDEQKKLVFDTLEDWVGVEID